MGLQSNRRGNMRNIAFAAIGLVLSVLFMTAGAAAQQHVEAAGKWNNPVGASVGGLLNARLWTRARAKSRARAKTHNSAQGKVAPARKGNAPAEPAPDAGNTSAQVD